MTKIKFGQIGVGNWGKNLLRNFDNHPDTNLIAVSDVSKEILAAVGRQYPSVQLLENAQNLIQHPETEAVIIATEPVTHYKFALEALKAGKHVFVEKPMTLVPKESESLVELAKKNNRILMVGHILEYHPAYRKAKELMDSGELGAVHYMYSTRVNLGIIRKDENALWSLAPHDISIALMFMQNLPIQVACTGQSFLQPGIEDVVFLTMHFSHQRMAHVHCSWLDPHKVRKLTVVGSKKMVVVDDMEANEKVRIYDKGVEKKPKYANYSEMLTLRNGDIQIPRLEMKEPLRLECDQFIKSIRSGKNPPSDGKDGHMVVKILAAADKSLKNGGKPIKIS
ncbi:Gfo/Idh/MocA family oxidoreductase [candidate division KSB1 bacterium]|nr:Gfo/Idh/MocA family oxidoreductase [candidate division KSB1 bacterium]